MSAAVKPEIGRRAYVFGESTHEVRTYIRFERGVDVKLEECEASNGGDTPHWSLAVSKTGKSIDDCRERVRQALWQMKVVIDEVIDDNGAWKPNEDDEGRFIHQVGSS